ISGTAFSFGGNGVMQATGDGIYLFRNSGQTDFTRLMLGGNTASFPAIGRSGTGLTFPLADGTGGATLNISVDRALILTNQTSSAAASVGTLTNAPAAGNPGFWAKISIGGVNYAFPCWAG